MNFYSCKNAAQLEELYQQERKHFESCKAQGLNLNMARGKPAKLQLDMVSDILTVLQNGDDCIVDGLDSRNYGELAGLPCAREYWADVLGCKPEQVFVGVTDFLLAELLYSSISGKEAPIAVAARIIILLTGSINSRLVNNKLSSTIAILQIRCDLVSTSFHPL